MLKNIKLFLWCVVIIFLKTNSIFSATVVAKLIAFSGDVQYKKTATTKWIKVTSKLNLSAIDNIKTGKNSTADIVFSTGSKTRIFSNANLTLFAPITNIKNAKNKTSTINILKGKILSKVKKGSNFSVATPTSLCGVRSTIFAVDVKEDGNTFVSVTEGVVEVIGAELSVLVDPQEQTFIQEGEEPENPTPISEEELNFYKEEQEWIETPVEENFETNEEGYIEGSENYEETQIEDEEAEAFLEELIYQGLLTPEGSVLLYEEYHDIGFPDEVIPKK